MEDVGSKMTGHEIKVMCVDKGIKIKDLAKKIGTNLHMLSVAINSDKILSKAERYLKNL